MIHFLAQGGTHFSRSQTPTEFPAKMFFLARKFFFFFFFFFLSISACFFCFFSFFFMYFSFVFSLLRFFIFLLSCFEHFYVISFTTLLLFLVLAVSLSHPHVTRSAKILQVKNTHCLFVSINSGLELCHREASSKQLLNRIMIDQNINNKTVRVVLFAENEWICCLRDLSRILTHPHQTCARSHKWVWRPVTKRWRKPLVNPWGGAFGPSLLVPKFYSRCAVSCAA